MGPTFGNRVGRSGSASKKPHTGRIAMTTDTETKALAMRIVGLADALKNIEDHQDSGDCAVPALAEAIGDAAARIAALARNGKRSNGKRRA